jgi:hypothetical protein
MTGGTAFKSRFCKHSVNAVDIDGTNGNRRIQVAARVNQHAAALHFSCPQLFSCRRRS